VYEKWRILNSHNSKEEDNREETPKRARFIIVRVYNPKNNFNIHNVLLIYTTRALAIALLFFFLQSSG